MAVQSGATPKDGEVSFSDRALALAVHPQQAVSVEDFRALQSVYLTNLPKTTEWGKDLSREGAFALAKAAAMTGLDPLLGHILMLGGKITISMVGIMHVANAKENESKYDGFTCDPLTEEERKLHRIPEYEHAYRCLVYRKDRKYPVPGIGRASKDNVKAAPMQVWLQELAQKRAVERAHRIAFNLPFVGADEPDDEHHMKVVHEAHDLESGDAEVNESVTECHALYDELRFSVAKRKIYESKYPDPAELLAVLRKERDESKNARRGGKGNAIDATADAKKESAAEGGASVQSLLSDLTNDEVPA